MMTWREILDAANRALHDGKTAEAEHWMALLQHSVKMDRARLVIERLIQNGQNKELQS